MRVAPRVWRSVDADLFRFTTTELRDLHVALMAAFEEVAVLVPALNLDQVRSALVGIGWDEPLDDTADFDRGGLGVTAWLAQRAGTTPWHMTTLDYLTALATDRPRPSRSSPLPATPWDPQLGPTMESHAVAVHEEELRTALLTAMEAGS